MKRERFEWIHSWCDETEKSDLPRVLLVGDSICHGYQEKVRAQLKGICYVDYVATSYAIDNRMYNDLVKSFLKGNDYQLLHINHGLHGIHMSQNCYKRRFAKLLSFVKKDVKVIIATSTCVYQKGNNNFDKRWMKRVEERNAAVQELIVENDYCLDDLYEVSMQMSKDLRNQDGTHYLDEGYEVLATAVVNSIKQILLKEE